MITKAYLEITNVCNLDCSFCHKTKRAPKFLEICEFDTLTDKLYGKIKYLYFHLLGEPLIHPNLEEFLEISKEKNFKVIITTNGTLIDEKKEILLKSQALFKVSISLHSHEANKNSANLENYLFGIFEFAKECAENKKICALRLWNIGGEDKNNNFILNELKKFFPNEWEKVRNGFKLSEYIFLEEAEKFDWPDINAQSVNKNLFCRGLRDQIGILCDGNVVPCCLDADGEVTLGNLFSSSLEDILNSDRAKNIYRGFTERTPLEELCKKCTYAKRFDK